MIRLFNEQKACPIPIERLGRLLKEAVRAAGVRSGELVVVYLNRAPMRRLNQNFLGRKEDTDVLAFDRTGRTRPGRARRRPLDHVEGDIAVCVPVVRRQALAFGVPFEEELLRCTLHGVLHLMGYDDTDEKQAQRMHTRQERILRILGHHSTDASLGL